MELAPLLLPKKDAARILGISVRKLEYLIAGGELQARKIGRRVLLPYRSLLRFAGQSIKPSLEPKTAERTIAAESGNGELAEK